MTRDGDSFSKLNNDDCVLPSSHDASSEVLEKLRQVYEKRKEIARKRALVAQHKASIEEATARVNDDLMRAERERDLKLANLRSIIERHTLQKFAEESRRVNPTNDCFHIWHDGNFGVINGLRMGNYGANVPWSEINAAIGTSALLLAVLANRPGSCFRPTYEIVPMGGFSKITTRPRRRGDTVVTYNLFSDDSFQIFGKRNFNTALGMLLCCLKDASDAVILRDRTMAFPYAIVSTGTRPTDLTIGGLNIAYEKKGEQWTRALKYFLTDLKWLVAFSTKNVDR
mmetsp:Transcript_13779/g.18028  ORF Transcript_13779/g.18028 Transcript_13779/m.18028 type:complete len:284 (-) Transcript_13779:1108-1959(-)